MIGFAADLVGGSLRLEQIEGTEDEHVLPVPIHHWTSDAAIGSV
jgi:hypothetical protein